MELTGIIVNLNEKGFGFIQSEGIDKNIFFHAKDLRRIRFEQIRKGDKVSIDTIVETDKGYNASGVYLIS